MKSVLFILVFSIFVTLTDSSKVDTNQMDLLDSLIVEGNEIEQDIDSMRLQIRSLIMKLDTTKNF